MGRKQQKKIDTSGTPGEPLGGNVFGEALDGLENALPAGTHGAGGATPARGGPGRARKPGGRGPVSIRRETQGRAGKAVTVVYDFPPGVSMAEGKAILKTLQGRCAAGGSQKEGRLEIQGEHLETVGDGLRELGFRPVQRGG